MHFSCSEAGRESFWSLVRLDKILVGRKIPYALVERNWRQIVFQNSPSAHGHWYDKSLSSKHVSSLASYVDIRLVMQLRDEPKECLGTRLQ